MGPGSLTKGLDLSSMRGPSGGIDLASGQAESQSGSLAPSGGGSGGGGGLSSLAAIAHVQYDLTAEDLADSTSISSLTDQTSNGRDAAQATSSLRPTAQTVSGMKVSSHSTDLLTSSFTTLAQPYTVVMLVAADAASGTQNFFSGLSSPEVSIYKFSGLFQMFAGSFFSSGVAVDTNWHVHVCVFNGSSSAYYLDGGSGASGNPGTSALTDGLQFGGSIGWVGDINFMSLYDGDLVASDLTTLNGAGAELAARIGITWTDI